MAAVYSCKEKKTIRFVSLSWYFGFENEDKICLIELVFLDLGTCNWNDDMG